MFFFLYLVVFEVSYDFVLKYCGFKYVVVKFVVGGCGLGWY